MTDEEAQLALELLASDEEIELPPLTREDLIAVNRALLNELEGRVVPHDEVLRRFGRRSS